MRHIVIHNHLPKKRKVKDSADEPYQVAEGRKAAEEGQPEDPPYPPKSVPRDWWLRGYRSVKKPAA